MNAEYWTPPRIAGGFLVTSLLLMLLAAGVMVVTGAISGFGSMISGNIAAAAPYADTFRLLIQLFILAWIVQLLGFGVFIRLLAQAGEWELASVTFLIILMATVTAAVNFSFRMTIELWAGQQLAGGRDLPSLYEPLRGWTSALFRLGYRGHLLAMIGVGWAILRSRLLDPWVGWATVSWSGLWLLAALVGAGAPAVPLLMPALIGFSLLRKR